MFLVDSGAAAVQRAASAAAAAVRCDAASSGRARAISGGPAADIANGIRAPPRRASRTRRGRIPPPALCRHDARRGPADRLRLSRQAQPTARHLACAGQPRRWPARRRPRRSRTRILGGTRYRYRVVQQPARPERSDERDAAAGVAKAEAPAWLGQPVPAEPVLPRPLSPSGASASIEGGIEPVALAARRCSRPATSRPSRSRGAWPCTGCCRCCRHRRRRPRAAARRYLERVGGTGRRASATARWRSVMRVLADADLRADLFARFARRSGYGRNARRSAASSGRLGQDRPAGGDAGEVLIVDYKTNRPAPSGSKRCRRPMSRSSRSTARCCSRSIPAAVVKAALLFTEAPLLIAVPAAAHGRCPCPTHAGVTQDLLEAGRSLAPHIVRTRIPKGFSEMATVKVDKNNFKSRRAGGQPAGRRGFLGRVVRPLQDDRAGARGNRRPSSAARSRSPSSTSTRIRSSPRSSACARSRR